MLAAPQQTYFDGGDGGEHEGGVGVAQRVQQAQRRVAHRVVADLRVSAATRTHLANDRVQHTRTTALHAAEQRHHAVFGEGGEDHALAAGALPVPVQHVLVELKQEGVSLEEPVVDHVADLVEQNTRSPHLGLLALRERVLVAKKQLVKLLLQLGQQSAPHRMLVFLVLTACCDAKPRCRTGRGE